MTHKSYLHIFLKFLNKELTYCKVLFITMVASYLDKIFWFISCGSFIVIVFLFFDVQSMNRITLFLTMTYIWSVITSFLVTKIIHSLVSSNWKMSLHHIHRNKWHIHIYFSCYIYFKRRKIFKMLLL
jgi:hypothetical protein